MKNILIVEDDLTFSLMLTKWLEKKRFKVSSTSSVKEAMKLLESAEFDTVLTDMRLPDGDGSELLAWIVKTLPSTETIVMTGYADINNAVTCMKMGAKDYITKPINPEDLMSKIMSEPASRNIHNQQNPIKPAVRTIDDSASENYIYGSSPLAAKMYEHIRLVGPTGISVLIHGSSGTGKEHIASLIHSFSNRRNKPFIAVDCGAIPKDLAGSEFFGHRKGSFTGALNDKTGAFAEANGGTIFLDEVGNLSYDVQVQLLRAIQEKKIRPIGTNIEMDVDIRVIAATNENLLNAIKEGKFREDLYHRLNGFCLEVPDLKEQREDIMKYAEFFLKKANTELGRNVKGFSKKAASMLVSYDWPGNIRELKNAVTRSVLLCTGDTVTEDLLPAEISSEKPEDLSLKNRDEEKNTIIRAIEAAGGNKSKASQLLGIDRKTLYNKIKLYGIED